MTLLPISAVIPTLNRQERLRRTVASMFAQDVVPAEIIIVDASLPPTNERELPPPPPGVHLRCLPAATTGAGAQRNQGVAAAVQPFILFADDDIDLAPSCLAALWNAMQADPHMGGCGVIISNLHYHPPGRLMRRLYTLLGCPAHGSLAGHCCGPALNFLPANDRSAPPAVDWMNLACTLIRRSALPEPPLLEFFHGYSLMEDVALTLHIGRRWRLASLPAACVYHDTMPARYKDDAFTRERMEMLNRWFVMRQIMDRRGLVWGLRQLTWQVASLALSLRTATGRRRFPAAAAGKISALTAVILHRRRWRGYSPDSPCSH